MENFEVPKLNFFKTKLNYSGSDISRTEWNTYFDRYFETSQWYKKSIIASLQGKILILTEPNKRLNKDTMHSKASGSSSLASLLKILPLASSSSFLCAHGCLLYMLTSSCANSLTKLPFFSETLPTAFSSILFRACPSKIKSSEYLEATFLVSYIP